MPASISSLPKSVSNFIRQYGLLSGGEKVLVAVSGGPDSVCLLHVLNSLKDELGIQLHIAHLDHSLRGSESDADSQYVSDLSAKLNLPVSIAKKDVREQSEQGKISLEEAAREARYRFLDETAHEVGASRVAVGHTHNDQVETVLMHYLRGTGVQGLRGLRPAVPMPYGGKENGVWVIRPLLNLTREQTVEYCNSLDLKPRHDSSNEQPGFLRNRIRMELLPLLRQYNPDIDDAITRLADLAGEDADLLDAQAAAAYDQTASAEGCLTCLDSGKLRGAPLALQRRVFRIALEQSYGSLKDIEAQHVNALVDLLFGATGRCVSLPGGVTVTNERSRMVISKPGDPVCPWPVLTQSYDLKIPGQTKLPGWDVTSEIIGENFYRDDDIFSASLDLAKAGRSLTIRSRKPGDRFRPLGMEHSRKLQDFMVDAAIPRSWRDTVPLVCSPSQIVWVVGWRIDDRVKVTGGTGQVLRLEFHRLSQDPK
ncbi:MAG: tRNA lysidine(34) synthetase TilS [Dehalococcoidia bacterium]